MSARDNLALVRASVNAHRNHDAAREESLSLSIENGDFERDPYSLHVPPNKFSAPCGCVARIEKQCDGDSVWPEWVWNDRACVQQEEQSNG